MRINSLPGIQNPALERLASQSGTTTRLDEGTKRNDFAELLMDALKDVNANQLEARATQDSFMAGRQSVDYHDLMIAMEKASVAMQLTMTVRNKILEAYQEISRMQV
jgi:flagellar hook-basal body complex protein FliE